MLRHVFTAVLLCVLFPGCASKPAEPLRLRVLTYNIHHGEGADGEFDYPRLADIINRADPDLVALQEVDVKTKRSKDIDQAAKLAELTGMHVFFAEAMAYRGGRYGNAVLSRQPIRAFYQHKLSNPDKQEPRTAAVASVMQWQDQPPVVFASTHLCHQSEKNRLRQSRSFIGHRAYEGPLTILAGDFNFTPNSAPYQVMIDTGWVDAAAHFGDPQPTVPADQPESRIDYIFVRPENAWQVIDVRVLDEPIASDHAPLLIELEYVAP